MRGYFLRFVVFLMMGNLVFGAAEGEEELPTYRIRWVIGGDLDQLKEEGTRPTLYFKEWMEDNCCDERAGEFVGEGMMQSYKISDFLEDYSSDSEIGCPEDDRPFTASKQIIALSDVYLTVIKDGHEVCLIENALARWCLNKDFYGLSVIRFLLQKEPYSGIWGMRAELVKDFDGEQHTFFQSV